MEQENFIEILELIYNKKEHLEDYISSYLKLHLNKHNTKEFISFNLLNESGEIVNRSDFNKDKSEYIKVFWSILRGKQKYENNYVELSITQPVINYTTEGLVDYYRNDNEIIKSIITLLKKENFITLIKEKLNETNTDQNDEVIKDLMSVFDLEKEDTLQAEANTYRLLETALASPQIKDYVYNTLKDTELSYEIKWELRKYLYSAMGISVSGLIPVLPLLPILIAGVLVGAVAFKKSVIKLISFGVSNKITNNIKVITQAIFSAIEFQKILSNEIINSTNREKVNKNDVISETNTEKEKEKIIVDNISNKNKEEKKIPISEETFKIKNTFAYLKIMSAMMWADGKLEPEEKDLWKKIATLDLGLSIKQVKELEEWFKEGPNLSIIGSEITDEKERIFVMRQAVLMAMIDSDLDPNEKRLIYKLGKEFDITEDDIDSMIKETKNMMNLE